MITVYIMVILEMLMRMRKMIQPREDVLQKTSKVTHRVSKHQEPRIVLVVKMHFGHFLSFLCRFPLH